MSGSRREWIRECPRCGVHVDDARFKSNASFKSHLHFHGYYVDGKAVNADEGVQHLKRQIATARSRLTALETKQKKPAGPRFLSRIFGRR